MANIKVVKDLFFKLRYGFQGVPFQVGNHTISLDESLRRWDLGIESAVHQVLEQYLKSGDVFVDIGANFGLHTLYAAKLVGEQGQVFAFEPVTSNLKLLNRNITLSKVDKQVRVVPNAVSNSSQAFLDFYLPPDEVAVTASLQPNQSDAQVIQVANVRLDDYWQDINLPIKMIKIDVEGAELGVLEGAEKLISKWKPILVIEVHGFALPSFGASVAELRNFLNKFGYQEMRLEGECFSGDDYFQAVYVI
jgi:FkbM family methyltransferase